MDPQKSADLYDRLAPDYDRQMAGPGDVWVRGAFQEFVRTRLSRGARLLDFGCGTGIDAGWYAGQGYRVLAFDNSNGMVERLRIACSSAIKHDEIEVWTASYETFLSKLATHGPVDAVAANFAVVNLLPDLQQWFAALAPCLPVGGQVFLSALNPLSLRDIGYASRLFRALRYMFQTGIPFPEEQNVHFRYWPRAIAQAARGYRAVSLAGTGSVIRYARGPRDWRNPVSFGERVEHHLWNRRPWNRLGKFVFMELRRCG